VVVEHGEHGGSAAASIAGRILRAYFDGKKPVQKPVGNSKIINEEDDGEIKPSIKEPRISGENAND
jgi:penicillin-binding protein 2